MKKTIKNIFKVLVGIIIVALIVQFILLIPSPQKDLRMNHLRHDIKYTKVPTLLINGYGGSNYTYNKMINYYQKENIAQKTMTIHVRPNGDVKVSGSIKNKKNALIQLLFDWNLSQTYNSQTKWTIKVIKILHEKYGVNQLNIVGHSWGGTEFLHALGQSKWLQRNVKFNKVILLGTPVNEAVNNKISYQKAQQEDKTDAQYQKLRKEYEKLDPIGKIQFYNVMADYKNNTDTSVPNVQSEFLYNILDSKWSTCETKIFYGIRHSALHQDVSVLDYVAHQLYNKNK